MTALREVLAAHWPHPVFGCECTPTDEDSGVKGSLDVSWEAHLEAAVLAWVRDRLDDADLHMRVTNRIHNALVLDGSRARAADAALEAVRADLAGEQGAMAPGDHRDDERRCRVCLACDPPRKSPSGLPMMRMYVCGTCGNKRCPAAGDCSKWECSGSNDPGQTPRPKRLSGPGMGEL